MLLAVGIIIGGIVAAAALAGIWMRDRARADGRPAARPCSILVPNERDCDNEPQHKCLPHSRGKSTLKFLPLLRWYTRKLCLIMKYVRGAFLFVVR